MSRAVGVGRGGGGGGRRVGPGPPPHFLGENWNKKKKDYCFTLENTELITQRNSPFDFKKHVTANYLTSRVRLNPCNAEKHIYGEQSASELNTTKTDACIYMFEALDLLVNGIKSRSDQPGYKKDL